MSRNWKGQLLRFTGFIPQKLDPNSLTTVWQDIVGEPSEFDEFKPRERFRRQSGPVAETLAMEVHVQPERLDVFFVPANVEGQVPVNDFGPVQHAIERANALLLPWLEKNAIGFTRIAMGVVVLSDVEEREAGYEAVMELVPSLRFDARSGVSDFLFQINRPKPSPQNGMILNRLMKWSVSRQQSFRLVVDPSGRPTPSEPVESYQLRLELDLSTPATASQDTLEPAIVLPIFGDLERFGLEIMQHGEMA